MTLLNFDLSKLTDDLSKLVDDALSELSDSKTKIDVDVVYDKYLGTGKGLISQRIDSEVMKMNHRWASWRKYRRSVCEAITTVSVAVQGRYDEIDDE